MNATTEQLVHFPAGTAYSCGDALFKPRSTDPAKVTCQVCRSEHQRLTDPRFQTR